MDIAVIGAGLAGLAAGVELTRTGHQVTVFEAADGPGGRVRTDEVDGHRLDRGFQILLTAYPQARDLLDLDALDLCPFAPGALIRADGAFHHVGDPLRDPASLLATARAPVGSPLDKARVLAFRRAVGRGTLAELWARPETTAAQRLTEAGFSPAMIERLLRPLFAGITLDAGLGGSSRVLEFVFRMLASGDAAVPAAGMGAIADQLAGRLPNGTLRLSTPVRAATGHLVTLDDGETVEADAVVVATGMTHAAALAGTEDRGWRGVTSVWLDAPTPPVTQPLLVLNGSGTGPINSMAVMSQVSPRYAPAGRSTVVVSSPAVRPGLPAELRAQLAEWFGPAVDGWEVLRVDEIERAQPVDPVGHDRVGAVRAASGAWVCGDHLQDPSINGALASGRTVARAITARAAA